MPLFYMIYQQVGYFTATAVSLVCDTILKKKIQSRLVPHDNDLNILLSPNAATDPTRIPIRATILSAISIMPVGIIIGLVLLLPGLSYGTKYQWSVLIAVMATVWRAPAFTLLTFNSKKKISPSNQVPLQNMIPQGLQFHD